VYECVNFKLNWFCLKGYRLNFYGIWEFNCGFSTVFKESGGGKRVWGSIRVEFKEALVGLEFLFGDYFLLAIGDFESMISELKGEENLIAFKVIKKNK
jgi:hypothetical protein